ncbi:histidine kinase [Hymenobacter negativus]|uniref:Histidine kinase n=1 Tax=Hymenobacter negativus TaxID=2795026 RepID=A0ABS3QNP5_9BACT|nr:sensor histidine kinase [Hymenobacter negativus]MBO2012897.1 histidine kinase [Hymenobacter negativus]
MARLLFFCVFLLALTSCKSEVRYEEADAVYRTGDDPRWVTPQYDDAGWKPERGPTGSQVFWVRNWVILAQRNPKIPLGLQVGTFGAFEVYWDGVLIGQNGELATRQRTEVPGTESSSYLVPDSLAKPGRHLVALRSTQAYLNHEERGTAIRLESYPRLLRAPLIVMSFMNLMAGAFLIAAIYYLFLFSSGSRKEPAILVFSIICLLFFALLIAEYIKFYVVIPYPRFYLRLEVIGWLTFAISLLVPLYFAIQFGFKRKGLLTGLMLAVLIGIYLINFNHYDLTAMRLSYAMWLASVAVVAAATVQQARGGGVVLAGLLASAVVNYFLVYDFGLFICFTLIVLCMLYLHAIRVRAMENERQAALLLSSRLKLELLKKNIQPHFIKNTLTSMLDWVEEAPKEGAVFIQALAREFDILNDMAEATLIPVGQEIELCRHHLQVMEFRKEIGYELQTTGIDPTDLMPPAIFHTVLENGITHSLPPLDGRIVFKLHFEHRGRHKRYTLLTCARNRPESGNGKPSTGFHYIEARLRESFGSNWEFCSEAVPEGWLTTINIGPAA